MKPKELLVQILSQDERIRRYEKAPTQDNAHKCIQAYKEAVVEFCKQYDETEMENNQCDGRKAGLPINERGNHIDTGPGGNFGCTRSMYAVCDHVSDGIIYTCIPPQRKCIKCGIFYPVLPNVK